MRYLLPDQPIRTFDEYLATDTGGLGIARAQDIGPAETIEELTRSGLRGRGGAGFPTGRKWQSIASVTDAPHYAVCNGAEGEPATFKDRALLRANPYQLVEGLLIAAFAVEAKEVFIAVKASFTDQIERVTTAVQEMQRAGICEDCSIAIVAGPEDYLYGEETALLEVIEGKDPLPRLVPPYQHGLFASTVVTGWESSPRDLSPRSANATLVNNVETLSSVPHILAQGSDWHRSMGTPDSPGNVVCTVVGDVIAPDVGEVELGTPLGDVIDLVGSGLGEGRRCKAVIPGVAAPVVTDLMIPLSYEGFERAGSAMGAAGYTVVDDTACMLTVARVLSRFLAEESCGQCPPCKLGSTEITERLDHLDEDGGTLEDLSTIEHWLGHVTDGNRCYLAVQERLVVMSILSTFVHEIDAHVRDGGCKNPREFTLPKLTDLRDGHASYAAPRTGTSTRAGA